MRRRRRVPPATVGVGDRVTLPSPRLLPSGLLPPVTTRANGAFDARPNILTGETPPNTLNGIGRPRAVARARLPVRLLVLGAIAILAWLALVLGVGVGSFGTPA